MCKKRKLTDPDKNQLSCFHHFNSKVDYFDWKTNYILDYTGRFTHDEKTSFKEKYCRLECQKCGLKGYAFNSGKKNILEITILDKAGIEFGEIIYKFNPKTMKIRNLNIIEKIIYYSKKAKRTIKDEIVIWGFKKGFYKGIKEVFTPYKPINNTYNIEKRERYVRENKLKEL